ncbi:uncharacterized protein LOC141883240 isoform X2 [Acropora palmata]|uniref:uncharacterized protein LOC141883240 isoform X2 n=1 Tax=Acropora palmata TaxID=6131 RepID=UPI003D9FB7CC
MKYFMGISILALLAGIRADDFQDLFLNEVASDEATNRHPLVQCNVDMYKCIKNGNISKKECMKKYVKCLQQLLPSELPPSLEKFLQCQKDMFKCIVAGNKTKLECLRESKRCLAELLPSQPPQFLQCTIVLFNCVKSGSQCMDSYKNCMKQLLPTKYPPFVQCSINSYNCMMAGNKTKKECLKEFKACTAALIPTVPPFVKTCKDVLKKCLSSQSTISAKAKCFVSFGKCLKNKEPGKSILDAMEDPSEMENAGLSGITKCKDDLKKCLLDGNDKKVCLKDFRSCAAALVPSYLKKCRDEGRICLSKASSILERFNCIAQFRTCIKKGKPTDPPQ